MSLILEVDTIDLTGTPSPVCELENETTSIGIKRSGVKIYTHQKRRKVESTIRQLKINRESEYLVKPATNEANTKPTANVPAAEQTDSIDAFPKNTNKEREDGPEHVSSTTRVIAYSNTAQLDEDNPDASGETSTWYKCPECSAVFNCVSHLNVHMRGHAGKSLYKCTQCSKIWADAYHLNRHIRTHTGEKPHKCTVCSCAFGDNYKLMRHMRTHTGEKPYQCEVCPRSFARRDQLRAHWKVHTGEKSFKCEMCPAEFEKKGDLSKHRKVHAYEEKLN